VQVADRQRNFLAPNARAKRLRKELRPAEERLRKLLAKIEGFHFRKQTSVGPYVFDFGDLGRRLLIELDGGIHALPEVQERDRVKSAWAEGQGFTVVRIPNSYVFGTGEPAVAMVLQASRLATPSRKRRAAPHPNPAPQGGGAFPRRLSP
jgi:very-short-patch-repair endonuclease